MKLRIKAFIQPDNIVPAFVVVTAFAVTLDPSLFGVEIKDRQIILLLFALLGIDAVIERSGRLYRIGNRIEQIADRMAGSGTAGEVLRDRASFERMGTLVVSAQRSVTIIGINLEAAVIALPELLDLAKAGVSIRLLAMDPDGGCLRPSAAMSAVDPEIRQQKIRQNLNLIKQRIGAQLTVPARRKCSLRVVDQILPVGVVGVDSDTGRGRLIVQHYLTATPAEKAPIIVLNREADREWFDRYLKQCDACFAGSREWQ